MGAKRGIPPAERAGARPLLVTCEHGGRRVPAPYRRLFRGRRELLESHRGYDEGALRLARELARQLRAPLLAVHTTRLLADANRSRANPRLFSEVTRNLDRDRKERLLARHWRPHREAAEATVARLLRAGAPVLHVSAHSFTPVLEGVVRRFDVGLLYDPSREAERELCSRWRAALGQADPGLRVRFNQPYRGTSDGLTTALRRTFPATRYLGIELEVNQEIVRGPAARWRALRALLARTLGESWGRR